MKPVRSHVLSLSISPTAVALLCLASVALACVPSFLVGRGGADKKLDVTTAGLVARHETASQVVGHTAADPLLVEPADAFVRISHDISGVRAFLEANGATVIVSRGSDSGYILAQVSVSLIAELAERVEVTEVSSGKVAATNELANMFMLHHEAGGYPVERLVVYLGVPLTYADYFLGREEGVKAVAENMEKLRAYLNGKEGVEITCDGGKRANSVKARVPLGLLRELTEMPFVDIVQVHELWVPDLTLEESSKIDREALAEIMTSYVTGVPHRASVSDDPNIITHPHIEVTDSTVQIGMRITGEDQATDAANGQTIVDFLTANGGRGEVEYVRWTGGYVLAVVPVSALVPLAKLPEVEDFTFGLPDESGPPSPPLPTRLVGDC